VYARSNAVNGAVTTWWSPPSYQLSPNGRASTSKLHADGCCFVSQ